MAKKNWQDIGNVKARQAARAAQYARDAAYRAKRNQTTVEDGQTLDQIAQANNTTVPDLLAANPDMTTPKTGMVLNLGAPGAYRPAYDPSARLGAEYGPGTTPSSSVSVTTNPTGWAGNRGYAPTTQSTIPTLGQSSTLGFNPIPQAKPLGSLQNAFNSVVQQAPRIINKVAAISPLAAISEMVNGPIVNPQVATATTGTPQANASTPSLAKQQKQAKDDFLPLEYLSLMQSPAYEPTEAQVKYLEKMGYIQKNTPPVPSYSIGRYKRRGGGGGRSGRPTSSAAPRAPAFSSGAGFGGLVNWRL